MPCNKLEFATEKEANTYKNIAHTPIVTLKGKRKRFSKKIPQRSYLCPECGMWHLTSKKH